MQDEAESVYQDHINTGIHVCSLKNDCPKFVLISSHTNFSEETP